MQGTKKQTRKMMTTRFFEGMTAEALLKKSVRYDRSGKPLEVVISYDEFIDFVETYGLDLTEDEKEAIHEAQAERKANRDENFVGIEEAKRELGL